MPASRGGADMEAGDCGAGILDLNEVLSRAEVGILHRDLALNVLAVNDHYCRLVGRTPDELAGLPMHIFTHPDDAARSLALHERQFAKGEPFQIEKRYQRPDGSVSWCIVNVSFVCDAAGRPTSTVTVALDVTKRREAEEELRESEEHYRNTVELAPQIAWTASPSGQIEEVSPRWAVITGMKPLEALGSGWQKALHDDDIEPTLEAWTHALRMGTPVDVEYRLWTPDAGYRWFRARAAARRDEQGQIVRWYGTLEDVNDRVLAERGLRESEERFRLAAEAAGLGIWDYDRLTGRREWSDELKIMLGLPRSAKPDLATALALIVPEDRPKLRNLAQRVQSGETDPRFDVTITMHRADTGEKRYMQTSGWSVQAATGRLERVLVTIRDITEEHTAEQRIRWAATHDALTGVPNRSHFSEKLEGAIARAREADTQIALILFDVDNLKQTNDTIGHDAGDRLLTIFAERLKAFSGEAGGIGRLGGDEFAIFLEHRDEAQMLAVARDILQRLHQPFEYDGGAVDCQSTAGCSILPRDADNAANLLKCADIALYAGKADCRGSLSIFDPAMRTILDRRTSMLRLARAALRDDRIMPFYQPKVCLLDERVVGFEALLRWTETGGDIEPPGSIAAAFEDLNLATAIGERMLDQVCRDIARWRAEGLDVGSVAFNLSPAEFRRDDLFDRIMSRLHQDRIPTSLLELEITESVFLGHDASAVARTLQAFHREGVRIALDDFGTGFASLTHLQSFPVDVIKIDRSFVSDVAARPGNAAIVKAVIGLARDLSMDVVAEGIETRQQADHLRQQGCTFGQGFWFGPAMPRDEVAELLRANRRDRASRGCL
ncbi:sensor domain-containing protein [Sphingomonas sp. PR090111-T3T-6A]|uniref:sensor domain-containing protein n=1 Tax=Sphingomonas sp. PR090111-T3T-6A TaxID=685778 RepID=UPI0003A817B3|nr:bifunctional diguanylate cyclase/phosphodiesterase [Sphingomonas sp. PR090111-T3T-6A]